MGCNKFYLEMSDVAVRYLHHHINCKLFYLFLVNISKFVFLIYVIDLGCIIACILIMEAFLLSYITFSSFSTMF
jgi:hypothetical protein